MKKNLFLRVIALLLMIFTLAGCFMACQGSGDPTDTDPSTEGQTPGGTAPEGTVGETEAETDAETDRQIVKQVQHQKMLQKAKASPSIF